MIRLRRQAEILTLLYRFRFLNRSHLQQLLGHSHFNRVIVWLNQLTTQGLIRRYYDPKTVTQAAVYSLGLKGRKYLKEKSKEAGSTINPQLLNRIWREPTLTLQFRSHCLFLADIYLSLCDTAKKHHATLHFFTKTDLVGHDYLLTPHPDAYIAFKEPRHPMKRYFLDIFDPLPPRMILRRRIKQYAEYYDDDTWYESTRHPFPKIIIISPDDRSMRYLYRFIQKILEGEEALEFYLSTWEAVKTHGLNSQVLQKVEDP